jgi:predicted site-specific integrase-resolvase
MQNHPHYDARVKVALYARVSTSDKDQTPETQLVHLRDFCAAQGWDIYQEYIDTASALDVAHTRYDEVILHIHFTLTVNPFPIKTSK